MKNIRIKNLAIEIMMPIDHLLKQLSYIGIYKSESDYITMQQKNILLKNIKNKPQRIIEKFTLQRKKRSTLNMASISGKSKEVQIEIRKNRTYLKEKFLPIFSKTDTIVTSDLNETKKNNNKIIHLSDLVTNKSNNLNSQPVQKRIKNIRKEKLKLIGNLVESSVKEKKISPDCFKNEIPEFTKNNNQLKNNFTDYCVLDVQKEDLLNSPALLNVGSKYEKNILEESRKRKSKRSNMQKLLGERKNFQNSRELKNNLDSIEFTFNNIGKKGKKIKKINISSNLLPKITKVEKIVTKTIVIGPKITISELANRMGIKSSQIIKILMNLGTMVTINQIIDQDTAQIVAEEMGYKVILRHENNLEKRLISPPTDNSMILESRFPVVTIMGHVDHGKTSLLDYIRSTKITSREVGGITQHIGAYHVKIGTKGSITFLDTPGHAAFTAMRARGVQLTDIVVLVIAADDGVMPQTIEAIQHAQLARVPVVVAINKIDKLYSDVEQIKNKLSNYNLIPEEWGGNTQYIGISAKTGKGIDELLDAILLQAEMLELTAIHTGIAKGVVIESYLDKGRGPIASVLVREGTIKKGDFLLCGLEYGRIKAMRDELGYDLFHAGPSRPVEILGLSGVPETGDIVTVVKNEKKAREVALLRKVKYREQKLASKKPSSIQTMLEDKKKDRILELNIIVKADVQGSVEAIVDTLNQLSSDKFQVNIVSSGVGSITDSDIVLATAVQAMIIGFNVRAESSARKIIPTSNIDIRYYSVIYKLIDEVQQVINCKIIPPSKPNIIGVAEVRNIFPLSKFGIIAGCIVIEGIVKRKKSIRILRDQIVIYEGVLESLRHFKDKVDEVKHGVECGIGVKNYNNIRTGDLIEILD
ncbi:MAG: translation initiation factor IF-2 [Candidatus Dasytiphilus stammeri]